MGDIFLYWEGTMDDLELFVVKCRWKYVQSTSMNGFCSLWDVGILKVDGKLDVGTQTPKHMCLKGLTGLEYRAHMIFDMNELLCFWAMGTLTINDWDRNTIWGMQACSLLYYLPRMWSELHWWGRPALFWKSATTPKWHKLLSVSTFYLVNHCWWNLT